MSAIVCGISLSFASCEDKDDLSIEEQQQQEESARIDKASRYWDVVGHLVSMENYTEEWEGKTFEPTIGSQDESDPQTRIVATNTASYAAERYSTLVGATGITESTVSHEWSDPEVGTLTYRKVTDGTAWAEVTVDIPTVPHLSKIIYRSPEQGNTNGGVVGGGCAYYRFGDVIGVTNADGKNEYWVCVRPAFDPEGKGDSHWMTVSPLPSKNIWTYDKASNKKIYTMPTALGTDEDHMKNFAEMLFAICYPSEWHANATGTHHPDIFGDFEVENIGYHNMYFWENVQDAWKELNVFETLFGSGKDLKWFTDNIKSKGLYFLYKGYKWKTKLFNGPTLFQAHYVYEKDSEYTNMRTPNSKALTEVEKDVIYKKDPSKDIEFSVKTECTDVKPYIVKPAYFGDDNPRWIVRYATGKQLSNTGKYPNNQAMIPGSETVYRYYRDVDKREDLSAKPQEEKRIYKYVVNNDKSKWTKTEFEGRGYYKLGEVYKDENGHRWFVINMSGRDKDNKSTEEPRNDKEASPIAELVSFDGLVLSDDKKQVTNLPTFDQAVRAIYYIHNFYVQGENLSDANLNNYMAGRNVKNIWDNTGIDLRHSFQQVVKSGGKGRDTNHQASIAYRDASVTDGQPLMRMLYLIGVNDAYNENPPYHFWKNYVTNPNATSTVYASTAFGTERILLQHIAKQDYVTNYAEDYYARLSLWTHSGGDGTTVRTPRSQADDRANNVANYYYNNAAFTNHTFPGDMWNAPVLMFRVTAVYDRGNGDHASVTLDGHTLTLVSSVSHYNGEDSYPGELEDNFSNAYSYLESLCKNMKRDSNYLNGALFSVATWNQAWQW